MSEWYSLAFGFALFFILERRAGEEKGGSIWWFSLRLSLAILLLVGVDTLFGFFLWRPSGRRDLGLFSLSLWALLVGEGINRIWKREGEGERRQMGLSRFYLALVSFSLWTIGGGEKRLFLGLALPLATALLEWLLAGLRDRVRLAQIPKALEGPPLFFWLAMLLSLAFQGFVERGGGFVN